MFSFCHVGLETTDILTESGKISLVQNEREVCDISVHVLKNEREIYIIAFRFDCILC
jgi:hypothetical protein